MRETDLFYKCLFLATMYDILLVNHTTVEDNERFQPHF